MTNAERGNANANPTDQREYLWRLVAEQTGLSIPETKKPLIAMSFTTDGRVHAMTAARLYATTALLVLRAAFLQVDGRA